MSARGPVDAPRAGSGGSEPAADDTAVREVVTNALHGWPNPTCTDCGKRALEVLDALTAHGYRVTKETPDA